MSPHPHIHCYSFLPHLDLLARLSHICPAEPNNVCALLFASVSFCSVWSCEREEKADDLNASCSSLLFCRGRFVLRSAAQGHTKTTKSPLSHAVAPNWMCTTRAAFHSGCSVSLSVPVPHPFSHRGDELEVIFARGDCLVDAAFHTSV